MELEAKWESLLADLRSHGRLLIAYSGGVDSAFLLWAAQQAAPGRCLGVLADSPSLPRRELADALDFAGTFRLPVRVIATDEFANPEYRNNPPNRCFFCKQALFSQMEALAGQEGFDALCYGENQDDWGDHRPGRQAAAQFKVLSPLRAAGLCKADIRALCRHHGLPHADKPAQPCLSSRIPHGSEVTPEKVRQIEEAESVLRQHGFRILRVRHHGKKALVQVSPEELPRLQLLREEVAPGLRQAGFESIEIDPAGYQGASLR
jgi:uncharacterized protein